MDTGAKLDSMANAIAAFFRPYPRAAAVAGIHDHIRSFWSPAMRRDLVDRLADGTARVDPLVLEAMQPMAAGDSPARREAAGPAERGDLGASDAG